MVKVYRSTVLDAPADRVWRDLRDFNGIANWHPLIESSRIEKGHPADKVGCVRSFQLKDGTRIREKLLSLSDYDFTYSYAILDSPMDLSDYVATLRLFLCFLPLLWLGSQISGIYGLMSGALVGNLFAGIMAYSFYRAGMARLRTEPASAKA